MINVFFLWSTHVKVILYIFNQYLSLFVKLFIVAIIHQCFRQPGQEKKIFLDDSA